MATTETERPVGDDPVIEITEEQKFVDDGGCGDTKVVPAHSESFVKQHVMPLKIMRQDIGHISYRKSVLVYPVTLADLQEPELLKHIEESQQFKISFIDRLQEHNTKGFLSLRYRTMGEADKAVESLKKWREDLIVRSKLSHDCTNRVLSEIRGNGPTGETQYMVFVRFLPEDVTEEALDELIPGSISVDIATNFKGEYRDYAYLTYKSQEQAKEVAEKYKDVEMGGKKLLVVHYGTYVEAPMKPEAITEALPDDKRIELLQQFQEMKTTFDEQSSSPTLTKNERKHLRNKLDMLRARIKKDTKMRVKENKSILDVENIPGLKADPPEKTGNNMGDNSGNKMGNNEANNTSDNQGNKTSENTGNSTVDVQPLSKKQRQNKRKHAEMAAAQAQRQPNQQQGVVGPGGNGMPDAGMNFLPNLTATAMNMLVGFLSNQLGQQMPQQQQQLPQLPEQMQLQQFHHQQQQQKFPQQQQQKKQQFQQKQHPQQQQQQQQQQQKQQQFQQQQMPMTEQELKKQERNRLKLQKRRQWQKIKRREKKLLQQGTGGADGAAPSTSTAGVSPSHSGADYNNGDAHNNMNLYGTAGYYDNKPCDLGFRDNNGGMCQSNFLDDDNTGTGGFYSNTQWQQGSAPAGGYGTFVSSGTISPANYGNSLSQENSYNLGAGYNLGSNGRFPGNSYHDNLGMDGDPGDQGSWKNKGGRRKGNNKKKRIS